MSGRVSLPDPRPGDRQSTPGRGGMRARLVRPAEREVLIAHLGGTRESQDDYTRLNCGGFGRIRRFETFSIHLRADPSLPAKPHYRGMPPVVPFETQVFQIGGCNWACWYCFVDDELLEGDARRGRFMTAGEMVDLYLAEPDRPEVLDLSGGQPDLVPEWCLWTMQAIEARGLRGAVRIWIDDNLSGSFMRRFLKPAEIAYMAEFPLHSRVGCFKGFSPESFALNTKASPRAFERQFGVMRDLIRDGFDMYAYATFTAEPTDRLAEQIRDFVDRLQDVDRQLPLRTIPLEVRPFTALQDRAAEVSGSWIAFQHEAVQTWEDELRSRFAPAELVASYDEIELASRCGGPVP